MTNVLSSFALIAATMPLRAISERHRPSHRRGLVATLRSNDFSPETIRTKFSKEKAVNDENLRRVNFRKRSHMIGLAKVFCSVTRDGNSSSKEGVDRCSPAESTDDNWLLRQETFSNIDWDEPFLATVSFGSEASDVKKTHGKTLLAMGHQTMSGASKTLVFAQTVQVVLRLHPQ